jgi:hypothetical protein
MMAIELRSGIVLLRIFRRREPSWSAAIRRYGTLIDPTSRIFPIGTLRSRIDAEALATIVLLSAVLVIGLATVPDYGITTDEFNSDDYGRKALAWYLSGFRDRSTFDSVEETLWFYGPWFHMAAAAVQSLGLLDPWNVRHAMTFMIGLAGLAALLPIGRLAVGHWAGFAAIVLCLITGNLYGSLFATPIDIPFLFAMTWATLSVMAMAAKVVPSWPATIAGGAMTGLAIATRSSGIITQVYLAGAMLLCMLEAMVGSRAWRADLLGIGARLLAAVAIGWAVAFALWPWLQIGNPFMQFQEAFSYFAHHPNSFETLLWGKSVLTTDLPWYYIPGELAVRLPEAFLLLLAAGLLAALAGVVCVLRVTRKAASQGGLAALRSAALFLARPRQALVVWIAVVLPAGFVMLAHSTLYDGIRHVIFLIPMLAVIAGRGAIYLAPLARASPALSAAIGGGLIGFSVWTLAVLHPLEYIATNVLAGGVAGAYGRFDLDYSSMAATVALRRLGRRIDTESPGRFAQAPPSITVCIGYRAHAVAPMFRRPWRLEVDPKAADFLVETERWPCADEVPGAVLIDEVRRFDRVFARTFVRPPMHKPSMTLSP